jgi:hypothetical protein
VTDVQQLCAGSFSVAISSEGANANTNTKPLSRFVILRVDTKEVENVPGKIDGYSIRRLRPNGETVHQVGTNTKMRGKPNHPKLAIRQAEIWTQEKYVERFLVTAIAA